MSDSNNFNEKNETAKLKISPKTDAESRKVIEETYNLYSSQKVEIEDEEVKIKGKKGTAPLTERKPLGVAKPLYKEITSAENLKPELQQLKQSMNSETKAKVEQLVQEITKKEEEFFTKEESMLGHLKKADKEVVTKKLEEMKVPKEITEVNVSAIISCIDNILPRKSN